MLPVGTKAHAYLAAAALLGIYLVHCWLVNYVVDDSFITFRYARNLVHGNGLVYNPGERVEGYTNFLWTILLSGFLWLNSNVDLLAVAQRLGVAFGAATIALTIGFSWRIHGKVSLSGLIAAAFLAANSAYIAWSTAGLETTFFAFLVFAGSYAYLVRLEDQRHWIAAPALFALAGLTRPEGLLFFSVVSAHLMIEEFRNRRKLLSGRLIVWAAVFAVVFLPYYLWRFNYYGFPFPNTFYAKVGGGADQYLRGLHYLWLFAKSFGLLLLLPPLVAIAFQPVRKRWAELFILQTGAYVTYVAYVGGDGLAFFRFMVPVLPFIYLLAQEGALLLYRWGSHLTLVQRTPLIPSAAGVLLALALVLTGKHALSAVLFPESYRWREPQSELSFPGTGRDHHYLWFDNYFVDRLAVAAKWLEHNAEPGAVVASTPAGAIGYYMSLNVIDMLGLNDLHIARATTENMGKGRAGHEKGDGRYVLSRSPDYILLGNVAVLPRKLEDDDMAKKLVRKSEHEIWRDPEFHNRYERVAVKLSDQGVFQYFTFYKRKAEPERISGRPAPTTKR